MAAAKKPPTIVESIEPTCLLDADGQHQVWHANSLDPEHVARVMGGRKADLLCVDAPYSERTHDGHDANKGSDGADRVALQYAFWSPATVHEFVCSWATHVRGWWVSITDFRLAEAWQSSFREAGLYDFIPLPMLETGSRVRLQGDGPSCWTCWIVVARPPSLSKWGTLPGAYVQPAERQPGRIVGGKPFRSMCAIVGDYSRPGDLVVDPCCGGGTTLTAARYIGRRSLGIDQKLEHAQLSAKQLGKARHQPELFT